MGKTTHKLSLLFSLYFCQGLPGGFLAVAFPVILREQGVSLTTIGFASLLSAPWILKIFWAPLVDRYSSTRFGRRKSWIIPAQSGMIAICLLFLLFNPEKDLYYMGLLFLILNFFAATQDIAVDGFAVDILRKDEMGPGNSAQVSGFKTGNLFGGGVLLALSGYLGWRGDFLIMALLILLAMTFLLLSNESGLGVHAAPEQDKKGPVLASLWKVLRAQGLFFWFFLVYAKFGETFGGAMIKPMLVDQGVSRPVIGMIDGLVGSIATRIGGILGGLVCRRYGWAKSLALFSVGQGLALIAIGIYSKTSLDLFVFGGINALENMCGGAVGVSIFALAMSLCIPEVGASQFTASQVIYMCGSFLAQPLAGRLADMTGYPPIMVTGGLMAVFLSILALTCGHKFLGPEQ